MGQAAFYKKITVGSLEDESNPYEPAPEDMDELPATTADFNAEGDALDDTDFFTEGSRSRIIGLLDWSVSGTLNWEPGDAGYDTIQTAFYQRNVVWVNYDPDGNETHTLGGPCVVESFSQTGGVEDLETVDFSLLSNDELIFAHNVTFDETNNVENAEITAYDEQGGDVVSPTVLTDASGEAVIRLPDGTYWYEAEEGDQTDSGEFIVDGEAITVSVTLA